MLFRSGSTSEGAFSWLKVGAVDELWPAFPPDLPDGLLEDEDEFWSSAWANENGVEASNARVTAHMEKRKKVRDDIIMKSSAFLPLLGSRTPSVRRNPSAKGHPQRLSGYPRANGSSREWL